MSANVRLASEMFQKKRSADNIDFYFFWSLFQILTNLDEEDNITHPSQPNLSPGEQGRQRSERYWVKYGIVDVLEHTTTGNRGTPLIILMINLLSYILVLISIMS